MLMGNIRTSFVKRLAKELIETHKGVFTTDFEENKKLVWICNKACEIRTNSRISFFHISYSFFYLIFFLMFYFLTDCPIICIILTILF